MDIRKYSPCMFCNDSFKGQSKGVIHTEGEIERSLVNKSFLIKSNVALILTDGKYQRQTSRLRLRMRKGSVWSVTYETLFYKFICDKQVYFAKLSRSFALGDDNDNVRLHTNWISFCRYK